MAHCECIEPNTLGKSGGWKSNVRCSGTSILCGCQCFSFRGVPGRYLAFYGKTENFLLFCATIRTRNGILGGKYRAALWIRSDGRCLCKILREN